MSRCVHPHIYLLASSTVTDEVDRVGAWAALLRVHAAVVPKLERRPVSASRRSSLGTTAACTRSRAAQAPTRSTSSVTVLDASR